MKYSKQLFSCMIAISLLSACSANTEKSTNNGEDQVSNNEQTIKNETDAQSTEEKNDTDAEIEQEHSSEAEQNTEKVTNSSDSNSSVTNENEQTSVIDSIKKELKTTLPVLLPTELPLEDGKYLTATTKVEKNRYTVVFYESNKRVKINDPSLSKATKKSIIAKYKVVKYSNLEKANEIISFEDFSKVGGQKMNLGHQIIGYQDAGAGALWTSWNEGRWALATHTRTTKPEQGLELAKQAVEFLETNALPIPKPNGSIQLDAMKSTENKVRWQNKSIVFSVEKVKEPIDALKIATSVK